MTYWKCRSITFYLFNCVTPQPKNIFTHSLVGHSITAIKDNCVTCCHKAQSLTNVWLFFCQTQKKGTLSVHLMGWMLLVMENNRRPYPWTNMIARIAFRLKTIFFHWKEDYWKQYWGPLQWKTNRDWKEKA